MPKKSRPITRERVLDTALQIVDKQGLDELSMRRLASSLGIEAMSLYNHVRDKNDLLSGLVDLVLSSIELPDASLPWMEKLETIAMSLYGALVEHPALVLILASEQGSPTDIKILKGMDEIVAVLGETGLSPEQQVNAFRSLLAMCFGFVLAHTQGFSATKESAQAEWDNWNSNKWSGDTLPHLAKLAPYFLKTHADDDFKFMLRAYLNAISGLT